MIMNLANILKIAYAASKVAETGGYLASGGQQNQLSNFAGTAGQVIGAASTVAGVTGAGGAGGTADAAKPPTPPSGVPVKPGATLDIKPPPPVDVAGPTSMTEFKPNLTGGPGDAQLKIASQQQTNWLKQQQGDASLRIGPSTPKAMDPKNQLTVTQAYNKGLAQSGAKLNKAGQIVKPDGQAFKKPGITGWDRKAQLMAMDPMRRQRMLAIDKSTVSAAKNKKGPVKNNTGKPVMDTEKPKSPREESIDTKIAGAGGQKIQRNIGRDTDEELFIDPDKWFRA